MISLSVGLKIINFNINASTVAKLDMSITKFVMDGYLSKILRRKVNVQRQRAKKHFSEHLF